MKDVVLNNRLLEYLCCIPFPYADILKKQVKTSAITHSAHPGCYQIYFTPDKQAPQFPLWLNAMPLSWHVFVDSVPVDFLLFIKEGFLECLEVIDMDFREINWEYIWSAPIVERFEYDAASVCNIVNGKDISVSHIHISPPHICFAVVINARTADLTFKNCVVRKMVKNGDSNQHKLKITHTLFGFSIQSSDLDIDFDCKNMFLEWNAWGGAEGQQKTGGTRKIIL